MGRSPCENDASSWGTLRAYPGVAFIALPRSPALPTRFGLVELLHDSRATVNHDRPACQGPTMHGDVLSSATAVSGDDSTPTASAAVPSAARAGSLVVKPCGTSKSRTAGAANAARERTTRNSPDGHKQISPTLRLGAHPRAGPRQPARQRPAAPLDARGPVADSGNSADGGTRGHPPSAATPGWHANAANGLLHPDIPRRNIALRSIRA